MGRDDPPETGWTEADSNAFEGLANIVVPSRQTQIDVLTRLIPAERDEAFAVVELGAGDGTLARAVMEAFPRCRYVALERSEQMRTRLEERLRMYGDRAAVRGFELADLAWRRALPQPLRCVLASLVVHHLSGPDKRRLFADTAVHLERGGALLLADVVQPETDRVQRLFALQWEASARAQSQERGDAAETFSQFIRGGWNHYARDNPDPYDQPSGLFEQLVWLREAGFETVDCFWMHAGHAIFGGYRG
jgi:tRNA (cmo5U34)-methyltransferase